MFFGMCGKDDCANDPPASAAAGVVAMWWRRGQLVTQKLCIIAGAYLCPGRSTSSKFSLCVCALREDGEL
jgi:hypothetical protein